jgi:acetolactate synthase-1/2/3 large subunit
VAVMSDMTAGRPRPGAVEIPIDLQHAVGDLEVPSPPPGRADDPSPAAIGEAAELLRGSKRPLIVAGGGVVAADAARELTGLAERLDAPVFTTIEGRGVIDEDHPLSMGPNLDLSAMDPILAAADVVLAVGTRFQQNNNVAKWLTFPGRLIHLDADVAMIGLVHRTDVRLVGDARLGLRALLEAVPSADAEAGWVESSQNRRDEVREASLAACGRDMREIMGTIRAALPPSAVVAKDATIAAYAWANRLLTVHEPRTAIRPTSLAIGPGLPLAIGAAVASGQPTVVIQGDGGLMLSLGELATAVQARLPLVICVFNDRGYGILRFIQDLMVEGRRTGVDLATPEFAPLAAAFGMRSAAVASAAEFASVFPEAVASGEPWLLDVDITSMDPMTIEPQPRPVR